MKQIVKSQLNNNKKARLFTQCLFRLFWLSMTYSNYFNSSEFNFFFRNNLLKILDLRLKKDKWNQKRVIKVYKIIYFQ